MKLFIPLLALFTCVTLYGSPELQVSFVQDELNIMDHLIERTASNIEQQKLIRSRIQEYKRFRHSFLTDSENKELACKLIATAEELLNQIDQTHLSPYFTQDFLEELRFFSQIAHKKNRVTPP